MAQDDAPTAYLTDTQASATASSTPAPRSPSGPALPAHLDRAELLGEGGMGEVYRVHEGSLKRSVALKTLRSRPAESPEHTARFLREACTTAQLQHPGIIAIHGIGTLPDGRPYFTMPEIRGDELSVQIDAHHTRGTPSLRDLIRMLRRACEPLAYAHAHGVVHRDFKPDNTMVGAHGDVLVLDWGLAKRVEDPDDTLDTAEPGELLIESPTLTRAGAMLGTPVYMAPEQITNQGLSPRTDVYALGAVLYEILNGHPPRVGTLAQVIHDTLNGVAPPACHGPPALVALVDTCLAMQPEDRPADAAAVGAALEAWLEGAERSAEADRLVEQAQRLADEARALRLEAEALLTEAEAVSSTLGPYADEASKAPGWALQDAAAERRRHADQLYHRVEQVLWSAVSRDAEHLGARRALIQRFRTDHARAELQADEQGALRFQEAMLAQLPFLPLAEREDHQRYLSGEATLDLETEPSGALVTARRIEEHHRRLVEGEALVLGTTPLQGVELAAGSWMLHLTHPDCDPARYPVLLERQGTWNRTPPGASEPQPVKLLPKGSLAEDECYVPAGWTTAGGDPEALRAHPAVTLWCHSFVMKRDLVTNRAYLAFLNALVARGEPALAERFCPRNYQGGEHVAEPLWGRHDDGTWFIAPDPDGDIWDPDWPVLMVDQASCQAYADWRSEQTGLPWRMAGEFEWEKAARGVDRRFYPWGNHLDVSWAAVEFHDGISLTRCDERPYDVSPYGVRCMGGNAAERCSESRNAPPNPGPFVEIGHHDPNEEGQASRGGSWGSPQYTIRCASRGITPIHRGLFNQSFRLTRSV